MASFGGYCGFSDDVYSYYLILKANLFLTLFFSAWNPEEKRGKRKSKKYIYTKLQIYIYTYIYMCVRVLKRVAYFFRYWASSSIEIKGMACFLPNSWQSFSLIMVPWSSSLTSSPMTATGLSPLSLHKSTPASVWPLLCKTPPSAALKGQMWPGFKNDLGVELESARALHVVDPVSYTHLDVYKRQVTPSIFKSW